MEKNLVRFTVSGLDFCILTEDSEDYIRSLASAAEEKINTYLKDNSGLSLIQAAVLTALEYADESKRKDHILETIKEQHKAYLDETEKLKAERDQYKEKAKKRIAENKKLNQTEK